MSKLLFLIIFFSTFPFFALAQLDYPYPVIPGTTITITEESTLGDLIKYLTSWAIIIGAIIAFLVLIYYGFIYLTSSFGAPERLREAKAKIFNAFLGLAILIGSYVIMLLINPQFMILRLEKQPIDEGIVLLTQEGHDDLPNKPIEEIIMAGEAVFIPPKIPDLRKINLQGRGRIKLNFGSLIVTKWEKKDVRTVAGASETQCEPIETNFKNFTLTHIGFLPKSQENLKILFFSNENFKSLDDKGKEYLPEGKIDKDGKIAIKAEEKQMVDGRIIKITKIEIDDDFKTKVDYKVDTNITSLLPECKRTVEVPPTIIPHPPLSLLRKPYGPGVYLYGDKIGEEFYLNLRERPLGIFSFKHSFKAKKIEIKNEPGAYDYIAVLFGEKNHVGDFKIIFKKRAILYPNTATPVVHGGYEAPDYENLDTTLHPPRQEINAIFSHYGTAILDKVSSVYLRELSDDVSDYLRGGTDKVSECERVWLCTQPSYQGECLVFTQRETRLKDKDYSDNPDVWLFSHARVGGQDSSPGLDLPFLKITNLKITDPDVEFIFKKYNDGTATTTTFNVENVFNNKIKSIKIEGSEKGTCMVVLYEKFSNDSYFPGSKSQVFFSSVPDLKGHKIHQCRLIEILLFWIDNPCASAIAVFPVKK